MLVAFEGKTVNVKDQYLFTLNFGWAISDGNLTERDKVSSLRYPNAPWLPVLLPISECRSQQQGQWLSSVPSGAGWPWAAALCVMREVSLALNDRAPAFWPYARAVLAMGGNPYMVIADNWQ